MKIPFRFIIFSMFAMLFAVAFAGGPSSVSPASPILPTVTVSTAQTGSVSHVISITAPTDGQIHFYEVGGFVNISAASSTTFQFQVSYTYASSGTTVTMAPQGTTSGSLTTTGYRPYPQVVFGVDSGSTVTVGAQMTGGTITYDVGASVKRIK